MAVANCERLEIANKSGRWNSDPRQICLDIAVRIAHVTDFYRPRLGGIETHVSGLAAQQRKRGHDVDVISANGLVESSAGPAFGNPRTLSSFSPVAIRRAMNLAVTGGYDVVHIHAGLATPLAFLTAHAVSNAAIPMVVTLHSVIGPLSPLYRVGNFAVPWRRWNAVFSAVSPLAAAPIQDLLGLETPVVILPNAVDVDGWSVDRVSHEPTRVVVTAVTRFTKRKRALPLLKALRRVREATDPRIRIEAVIIGEGSQEGAMRRYIARHKMGGWVTMPGRLSHEQIRESFRHSDVFVAPAIQESFGIAALEARAAGIPVIAMADSGIREFIEHERDGVLVPDDDALVAALGELVTDASRREAMAAHNRRIPVAFGWAEAVEAASRAYLRAGAVNDVQTDDSLVRPSGVAQGREWQELVA